MYVAVMPCAPDASFEVVSFAKPPLTFSVPRVVVPSRKVTVPAGVPVNCGATVAVKVTACPAVDGFSDDTSVVVLVALFTACAAAGDVPAAKFESPPYTTVTASVPTASVEVVKIAAPLLRFAVPSTAAPCLNLTVSPSGGLPTDEVTVATKYTVWP